MKIHILIIVLCLFGLTVTQGDSAVTTQVADASAGNQQTGGQVTVGQQGSQQSGQQVQQVQPEVVAEVGQIFPGQIDIAQSKQSMHLLKTNSLQKKYLFIRLSSFDKVRTALGIYSNQTRQLVHACEDNLFDSCYVPSNLLTANTVYVVLLVASDSMKYNIYTYWGDLEHIKPNQEIKFMFDDANPTQLFHLEFQNQKEFQQIRIILRPEATRAQGDNLKIFANVGFRQEPTVEKHDFQSIHIWGDAQAIILNKQQLKQQTGIAIYIVGSAETVYILQCEFLKQTSHTVKIGQVINDYLPSQKQSIYQLIFDEKLTNMTYVIKISSFTGQISAEFYYDKQLTKVFQKSPFQYMSDMQFNFDQQDLPKSTKQLYMKIKSYDSESTYQITTQTRTTELAYEIAENIYEFVVLYKTEAMYFYSHIWDSSQYQKLKVFRFDVSMIKINGDPEVQYYRCKADSEEDCKDVNHEKFLDRVEKLKVTGTEKIGAKTLATLEVNEDAYKKLNNVQKRLMVIIVIKNKSKQANALAVEYSNPNQIRLLRQGRAFEDKVRFQQKKYYKYINNNPKISQIRIHINQIQGLTKIRATRTDIKQNIGQDITTDKNLPDTIIIKDKVTDPIYIEVYGVVTSLYTVAVSAIHTEHLVSNSLVMAEDISYEVKLLPYQHMNIQLHPIQSQIYLEYYVEGGPVMLCQVDAKDLCVDERVIKSQGEMKIDASKKREVRVRIGNFIDSKSLDSNKAKDNLTSSLPQSINKVKLSLIYHGTSTKHCDERRMNRVYSENIKSGTCFKYHLPIASQFQIMISRSDLSQTAQNFYLCNIPIKPSQINNRFIVKTSQISQNCQRDTDNMNLMILLGDKNNQKEVKVDYLVSYDNDTITLADGVAYTAVGMSKQETSLNTFFYQIMDQDRDVNIVLYNKKGIQKFYAKVMNKTERYSGFVTESEAKYDSKTSNYYTNPYIKITPDAISDARCGRTCVLVLSIYSTQKTGTEIQFAVQVTQNHIFLKQDHIRTEFLPKSSVKFYEYESKEGKNTILFKISDNNRKCARSIMSKNPFPTGSNYYVKENQGVIVYEKTQKGTFYFAVQAIEDCPYTVSISESMGKITKIEYGQFYDIKLQQGEQKYFYVHHISPTTFKLIFLKQYGELQLRANSTELTKQILQQIEQKSIKNFKFSFRSSYKNTLVVKSTQPEFCTNCYYLIYVKAMKMTQGSIFLGSENSKIAISQDKILFDQIQTKEAVTYATFYKVSDGNLQVKVHKGKINMQMTYSTQNFSKTFAQNKKVYHETYNFTKQQGLYSPIQIRVTALQIPALYSFELTPSKQSQTFVHKVSPGQHTFVFLDRGNVECFEGTITEKEEEVFVSADVSEKFLLANLNIEVRLDGNETDKYEKQVVGNILSIRFIAPQTFIPKPKKYHICLNTSSKNDSLSLFIFQNQNINLIHPDTQILIRKQSKFVLYPRNDIILDLFQCVGTAQIYYGNKLENIRDKESHKLDFIGIHGQSHAVRISQFSTLYVDVVAPMATVLWMPVDEKEERGVGYFRYAIGGLEFSSKFNSIQFNIGGVYVLKQTKTKVVSIKYTLFVANSKQLLQQAVMCQKNTKQDLVSTTLTTQTAGSDSSHTITISIQKKRITDTFPQNQTLYFNVVADLTLQSPQSTDNEDHEHYRFVYYQQVVPSEVFRQNKVESMQLTLLIVLAVVTVLGFVLVSWVFVRCVVPALGRLKNRVLVEEKEDPKDQSIPVPPSSDRNAIGNIPSGTQEQMK